MRPSLPLILAALLTAGALTGCGLKDDLFLPAETAGPQERDPNDQDSDAEDAANSRT